MMLHVLSAGAAKGLIGDLRAAFEERSGMGLQGSFSAVGAIRERFEAGETCDVLILTARQLAELETAGRVGSVRPIGTVRTAVAVPAGHPRPDVSTGAALATAFRAASAVYMPDAFKSTAGIHIRSVIAALGLTAEMAPKLRMFPNGETAMRALAQEAPAGALGTTQMTEILYTERLDLVASLPSEHELSTVYAVAMSAQTGHAQAAAELVRLLCDTQTFDLRRRSGFEGADTT